MTIKLIVSLLIAVVLVAGIYKVSSSNQKQRELEELLERQRGTAMWYVTKAKIEGKSRALLPTRISDYPSPDSLDQALLHNRPVVVQFLEKKSQLFDGEWVGIITWCKFRVIEELPASPVACLTCGQDESKPPVELLPLAPDEILICKTGGEVEVDGVKLVEVDRYLPQFLESERYLLFVSPGGLGTVNRLLMVGTFRLSETGGISSMFEEGPNPEPLNQDLTTRYSNSLDALRADLRSRIHRDPLVQEYQRIPSAAFLQLVRAAAKS
jgi:hypothetical protein